MSVEDLKKIIGFEFDHVGVAVPSIEVAGKAYESMGLVASPVETIDSEKVRVKMFTLDNNARIELLEPTSDDSVIYKFIGKRGSGIHHICLRVRDIIGVLQKLKEARFKLIHEEPFIGAHNCRVAFIHPSSMGGVLVELSEPMETAR